MTKNTLSIDQLVELQGQELGSSQWMTIDQNMINTFADVTQDHQFIHVDEEAARQTPFGGTIAHGFFNTLFTFSDGRSSLADCTGAEIWRELWHQ
ncbi:maoC like domain protein [Acinetobacter baumannii 318814]|nr:maoC like domain protein [Acinetobacter baumannii 318814]